MEIKEFKHIEIFDKYINNALNNIEVLNFNKRISEDTEFKEEFDDYKEIISSLQLAKIKSMVEKKHQELKKKGFFNKKKPTVSVLKISAIAASLLLMLLTCWWIFTSKTIDNRQIYSTYFEYLPNGTEKDLDNILSASFIDDQQYTNTELLQKGFNNYKNRNFEGAITYFNQFLLINPEIVEVNYYVALSKMNLEKYDEAITILKKVSSSGNSEYQQRAQFYLFLCFIANGNLEESKLQLETISNTPNHLYYKSAMEILKQLKK